MKIWLFVIFQVRLSLTLSHLSQNALDLFKKTRSFCDPVTMDDFVLGRYREIFLVNNEITDFKSSNDSLTIGDRSFKIVAGKTLSLEGLYSDSCSSLKSDLHLQEVCDGLHTIKIISNGATLKALKNERETAMSVEAFGDSLAIKLSGIRTPFVFIKLLAGNVPLT